MKISLREKIEFHVLARVLETLFEARWFGLGGFTESVEGITDFLKTR